MDESRVGNYLRRCMCSFFSYRTGLSRGWFRVGYSVVSDRVVENVCECSYTEGVEVFKVDVRYVVGTY